jgi:hypothetical protein
MKLATSAHLTQGFSDTRAAQIRKTHVGMASWAAEGPFGRTCGECEHYGCWKQVCDVNGNVVKTVFHSSRCAMFRRLTGKLGAAVPANAEACRLFVVKKT